jgi:ABC-type multidrug transport system fused ATPase/permease subunit
MVDYYELVSKAVGALPISEDASSARRAVYERARRALSIRLRETKPPLPESDIRREEDALSNAIRKIESEIEAKLKAADVERELVSAPNSSKGERTAVENALLKFEDVSFRYGHGKTILRDVSLQIRPSTLTFLTGESGSGKTTFLRLAIGLERPSSGKVTTLGIDTATTKRSDLLTIRSRVG